jgi:hypothetical protein
MNVHEALTKHIQTKEKAIRQFQSLDERRETEIERIVDLCRSGQAFSTDEVNRITEQMKELGRANLLHFPERKWITVGMVREYVQTKGK